MVDFNLGPHNNGDYSIGCCYDGADRRLSDSRLWRGTYNGGPRRGEGHSAEGSARSDPFESIGESMCVFLFFVMVVACSKSCF